MKTVILAALGVGGATVLGALGGFLFRNKIYKYQDAVNSFSAGLMLVAAMMGLLVPALEFGGVVTVIAGIVAGVLCLILCDRYLPILQKIMGGDREDGAEKVFLLFMAIAIHNFPEGMAAGVGFGNGSTAEAMLIAGEISLQNLPEGMVIIGPMLASGMSKGRTLFLSIVTAVIEIVGAMVGYFAVGIAYAILPFTLSFAGGMMLYVIFDEMIPDVHRSEGKNISISLSFILGLCFMLVFDSIL